MSNEYIQFGSSGHPIHCTMTMSGVSRCSYQLCPDSLHAEAAPDAIDPADPSGPGIAARFKLRCIFMWTFFSKQHIPIFAIQVYFAQSGLFLGINALITKSLSRSSHTGRDDATRTASQR